MAATFATPSTVIGLFLCLTFGQIGFKGRTEDYF
jgi:hypothetical protein